MGWTMEKEHLLLWKFKKRVGEEVSFFWSSPGQLQPLITFLYYLEFLEGTIREYVGLTLFLVSVCFAS